MYICTSYVRSVYVLCLLRNGHIKIDNIKIIYHPVVSWELLGNQLNYNLRNSASRQPNDWTKEVYGKNNVKSLIVLFVWLICFFYMLTVIFMWKATDIVALNFLPRTSTSHIAKVLSLHFLKRCKPDKNL